MQKLNILFAGVVKNQIAQTVERFQANHLELNLHQGGSVALARLVLDGEACDLLILADEQIFDSMLIPRFCEGYRIFAGNSIVAAAYDEAYTISTEDWESCLTDSQTSFGHYDPYQDPGGYRPLMTCMLADQYKPGLSEKLLNHPNRIMLKSKSDPHPPFMLTYRSTAVQATYPYAVLPDVMSLGDPELNTIYHQASFDLGDRLVYGKAISHALSIPFASQNKNAVRDFAAEFLKCDFTAAGFSVRQSVCGKDPLV